MAHRLSELGRRERQIMDVVIRLRRASAAEVGRGLPDAPSSSTVRTMLRLLERKGWVKHEWEGPRFIYTPTAPAETLRRSAVRHLLDTFFAGSVESAVASLLGGAAKPTPQELDRIAKLVVTARKRARAAR